MTKTDICVVLRALSLRTIGEEAASEIERLRAELDKQVSAEDLRAFIESQEPWTLSEVADLITQNFLVRRLSA